MNPTIFPDSVPRCRCCTLGSQTQPNSHLLKTALATRLNPTHEVLAHNLESHFQRSNPTSSPSDTTLPRNLQDTKAQRYTHPAPHHTQSKDEIADLEEELAIPRFKRNHVSRNSLVFSPAHIWQGQQILVYFPQSSSFDFFAFFPFFPLFPFNTYTPSHGSRGNNLYLSVKELLLMGVFLCG